MRRILEIKTKRKVKKVMQMMMMMMMTMMLGVKAKKIESRPLVVPF
jgi:hypothetical protein